MSISLKNILNNEKPKTEFWGTVALITTQLLNKPFIWVHWNLLLKLLCKHVTEFIEKL